MIPPVMLSMMSKLVPLNTVGCSSKSRNSYSTAFGPSEKATLAIHPSAALSTNVPNSSETTLPVAASCFTNTT